MRLYIDSNVIISLFREEIGHNLRPLYQEAELFIEKMKIGGDILIISSLALKEINKICKTQTEDVISYFKENNILFEYAQKKAFLKTSNFESKGIHFPDSMHIAIAITNYCHAIITFNKKDFDKQTEIAVLEPIEY